jgi:hypothetical protein
MKSTRKITSYICLDYKKKLDIMKELNVQQIMEFIVNYRSNWKNHILQMSCPRIPLQRLKYQLNG